MYDNETLKFAIMEITEKESKDYGRYFWCIYGMGGDCGFIEEPTAQYVMHKIVTLYNGEKWYETDKLIWNLIHKISEQYWKNH